MEGRMGVDPDALVNAAVGVQTLMDELARQDINDVDPAPLLLAMMGWPRRSAISATAGIMVCST